MTGSPFRMTIGDGVRINYDDGFLEVSPSSPPHFGITIPFQREDPTQEIRLEYGADDGILYLYCGYPVSTVSLECTVKEAGTLSENLDLPITDAYA